MLHPFASAPRLGPHHGRARSAPPPPRRHGSESTQHSVKANPDGLRWNTGSARPGTLPLVRDPSLRLSSVGPYRANHGVSEVNSEGRFAPSRRTRRWPVPMPAGPSIQAQHSQAEWGGSDENGHKPPNRFNRPAARLIIATPPSLTRGWDTRPRPALWMLTFC